ncbi:MAG: hypothetical protein AB2662_17365 [Candidatus Thiodiazotropha sp.]
MKHLFKILKNKLKHVSHAGILECSPEELTAEDIAEIINAKYDRIVIIGLNNNNEE